MCGKDICVMMSTTVYLWWQRVTICERVIQRKTCTTFAYPEFYQRTQPEEVACLQIYLWNWAQSMGSETRKRFKKEKETDYFFWGGKTKPNLHFHLSSKLVHFFKMERHFIFVLHQIYYFFFNLLEYSCFTMLLASTVQRSESAILTHTSPLFGFPSNLDQHRELSFLCYSVESQ